MAVDQVIPPTWRRHTVPRCPSCRRGVSKAYHRSCKVADHDDAHLYVDMATGRVHCAGCGGNWGFTNWNSYCRCGAVFKGGELWQGMKAEMGEAGELTWLKVEGRRKGTLKTTMLGWSFCLACGEEWHVETGLLQTGYTGGGLCEPCFHEIERRSAARFGRYRTKKPCSWCGDAWKRPIIKIGKARICRICLWHIAQQFIALAERERSKRPGRRRRKASTAT